MDNYAHLSIGSYNVDKHIHIQPYARKIESTTFNYTNLYTMLSCCPTNLIMTLILTDTVKIVFVQEPRNKQKISLYAEEMMKKKKRDAK